MSLETNPVYLHKTDFGDGPYRVEEVRGTVWGNPWAILNKRDHAVTYMDSEIEIRELAAAWNLKHAEWIMLQP